MSDDLRTIEREIASVLIYDCDDYLLMGRKKNADAVFADNWHIPGGGKEANETILETAVREVFEETGLDIISEQLEPVDEGAPTGESDKTLPSGEHVHCRMNFHRFKVKLTQSRQDIQLASGELESWRWFAPNEVVYNNNAVMYVAPRKELEG